MEQEVKDRLEQLDQHLEDRFMKLSQRMESQFRFTRFVVILCGMTIVGVLVFTVLTTFQSLPAQLIAHYMSNLEPIVYEWVGFEEAMRERAASRNAAEKAIPKTDSKTSDPAGKSGG